MSKNGTKKRGGIVKWIIIAVIVLGVIGAVTGEGNSESQDTETFLSTEILGSIPENDVDTEIVTETPAETESATETESEDSAEIPKQIDDVDILFSNSVINDTTGNWRLARVTTAKEIQEYALDYYNSYFQSDDEIHAIVNFTLKTTNRLSKLGTDILDVAVFDYVEKEEHDAKMLFSGTPLANYQIDISTGEVEEISLESDAPEETASDSPADAEQTDDGTAAAQAEPVPQADPAPQADVPDAEMVWLSATGSKYHSIPNCGKMDPNKARQVSKSEAEASGCSACSKCY